MLEVHEEEWGFYIKYFNDQKQQAYNFYFWENMKNTVVDTEDGNTVETEINGNQAFAVQKGDKVRILMSKNNMQFFVDGTIPYDEPLKIMERLK